MSRLFPFAGLLFDRDRVGSLDLVTTPPYDVISPEEQRRFRELSPFNVIRLELAEDRPGDDEVENKYVRAASELARWRADGMLVATSQPNYYPYEMRFRNHGADHRVRGVICAVELEDWGGSILPHERTMKGPVEDRLRLIRAVRANLSCIQAVFRGPCRPLAELLDGLEATEPAAATTDEAGVQHRMWTLPADVPIAEWLGAGSLMIADGHHRYTTALRYRDEMRAEGGRGPWDRTMMLIVDAETERPPVLPYHRILTAGEPPAVGERVRDLQEILDAVDDEDLVYGSVSREAGVVVHRVVRMDAEPPTVCALHESALIGLEDALRYTHDAVEAEEAVRRGDAVAAYLLPATDARRIRAVIDRGERLPQKSTFFWPKPRSGMVIRPLEASP